MMKLFAVRDVKADAFGAPQTISTRGLALRGFADACADSRSEFAKYPDDYSLYEVGTYDPNTGMVSAHRLPDFVASARSVVDQIKIAKNPEAVVDSEVSA